MKQKKPIPLEVVMAAVIMLLVLALAADGFARQGMPIEAAKYPIFVFCVVIVSGVVEIARCLRAQSSQETGAPEKKVFENRKNFLVVSGMIIGYVIAMWLLGFMLSTIIFAVLFAWYFKLKHLIVFDIAAVIVIVGLYYCFEKLLYIFLPAGLLFEKLF